MPNILITGSKGQVGSELQALHLQYPLYKWIFTDKETLDITDRAYILSDGKILRSGSPRELIDDADVRRLYLGERFTL